MDTTDTVDTGDSQPPPLPHGSREGRRGARSGPGHQGLGSELRQSALLLGLCAVTTAGAAGLAHAAVALLA